LAVQVRGLSFSYSASVNRQLAREEKLQRELQQLHPLAWSPNSTSIAAPVNPYAVKTSLPVSSAPVDSNKRAREILSDVDMDIPVGQVYGLLGPSGCGKTSLLRCLVGCVKAARGQIRLFGRRPETFTGDLAGRCVGFMPQETALYEDLSIGETLSYFGRLYRLSSDATKARADELMTLLDMPEPSRNVSQLSGGQRRRVSFAVALLHRPALLVLDEPTAGVDPLLRERVWAHLLGLCESQRTAVLLTTQYIEETRRAHRVAFMRNGRIIVEQSPEILLSATRATTLEDAFLHICLAEKRIRKSIRRPNPPNESPAAAAAENYYGHQTNGNHHNLPAIRPPTSDGNVAKSYMNSVDSNTTTTKTTVSGESLQNEFLANLPRLVRPPLPLHEPPLPRRPLSIRLRAWLGVFVALLWKNYLTDMRDPLAVCFQFVLPITQVVLFSLCIGGAPVHVPIAVVNDEIPFHSTPTGHELSPLLLKHINSSLVSLRTFESMDTALAAARRLDVWAVLHIRSNFSEALLERLDSESPLAHEHLDASVVDALDRPAPFYDPVGNRSSPQLHTLLAGRVSLHADMTNQVVALSTTRALFLHFQQFVREVLSDGTSHSSHALAQPPIVLSEPVYGEYRANEYNGFRDFMVPGIVCNITFAVAYTLTAVTLIKERNGQTIERSRVAGVGRTQLLAAHAIARFSLMLPYALMIVQLPVSMFDLPARGSLGTVFVLLVLINSSGMAYGMLVAALCATVEMAIILAAGTMFFLMFACGAIWPLQAVPIGFRWFAFATPLALPTESLRHILFKGWTLADPAVYHGFLVCLIYTFVFSFIGLRWFRMNK
jgi:ABC-type multidrug transport system ATPase subunit/ABC-type polysaccharide/polyol phosphate export permease